VTRNAIPPTDHVALHCKPTDFEVDPSGNRGGLKPDAFRVDGNGISSNWLEHETGSFAERLEKVSKILATLRHVRAKHACGVLNVGNIQEAGAAAGKDIFVVHDPVELPKANPGHALIKGIVPGDNVVLQALTLLVEIYPFGAETVAISAAIFGK
jgi:hypothetical protein